MNFKVKEEDEYKENEDDPEEKKYRTYQKIESSFKPKFAKDE